MLGSYLQGFRQKYELTQTEMANKIGITKGYYSRIEKNIVVPNSIKMLKSIIKVVEPDPYYLVAIKDYYLSKKEKEMERLRDLFDKN